MICSPHCRILETSEEKEPGHVASGSRTLLALQCRYNMCGPFASEGALTALRRHFSGCKAVLSALDRSLQHHGSMLLRPCLQCLTPSKFASGARGTGQFRFFAGKVGDEASAKRPATNTSFDRG